MRARRNRRWIQLNYRSLPLLRYRVRPGAIIERQAWRRSSDNDLWRTLAYGFIAARAVRTVVGRQPQVVSVERLKPGQHVTVRPISMKTKADRKAAKAWVPGRD